MWFQVLFHKFTQHSVAYAMGTPPGVTTVWSPSRITPIHWLMARDTALTSYVIDIDPRSCHLTPQIFLSSGAFGSRVFYGPCLDGFSLCFFPFQWPHVWLCEAAAWSSDAELEAMESEVFSLSIACASLREFFGQVLSRLSCTQPGGTGSRFLQDGGYFVYRCLRISPAYTELVDILARATEKLNLDWQDEPCESQSSKLDERFLSGSGSCPARRKLPFYPDLLHEISKSWKQPFSSHLTIVAATDFTNLVGSVEHGYAAVPVIEDTLTAHLSPNSAPSW